MGRDPGVLPAGFRAAGGSAAVLIDPGIITIGLNASGLVDIDWLPPNPGRMLILVAVFTVGPIADLMSRSGPEWTPAPVSARIAICSEILAGSVQPPTDRVRTLFPWTRTTPSPPGGRSNRDSCNSLRS
jgi:hypothetical protein